MARQIEINSFNKNLLCLAAKALSSPTRIDMMHLLYFRSYSVNEMSEKLSIPLSSVALNVNILEQAGLIRTEHKPGARGLQKICTINKDSITLNIIAKQKKVMQVESYNMPVGAFTTCDIYPTCGLADESHFIINEDIPSYFYSPNRLGAQIVWTAKGFLEYRFPNPAFELKKNVTRLTVSAELCSEAQGYNENWKSDITLWINGVECATWQSPGDFGARRGRLNPKWWMSGSTQYGLLTTWSVDDKGCSLNGMLTSGVSVPDFNLNSSGDICVRIGNKKEAKSVGGIVIFGKSFGDFEQDIVLTAEYE